MRQQVPNVTGTFVSAIIHFLKQSTNLLFSTHIPIKIANCWPM